MIPEISEFSYGFALTNELVGWIALSAAPIFPSLIEEGKAGGGYDVKLDQPGAPLYLQFKRADYMSRSNAREIKHHKLPLLVPFYRFPITQKNKSFQHTSLVELDDGTNLVFYAAPRFHLTSEINQAWKTQDVAARSIFVAPSTIGLIHDDDRHHVSYDAHRSYFCSEPTEIAALSATTVRARIEERLVSDKRPVREQLPEWLVNIRERRTRARETQLRMKAEIETQKKALQSDGLTALEGAVPRVSIRSQEATPALVTGSGPEIRAAKRLSAEAGILRTISDEALHGFGAQLFVVQPKS